MCRTYSGVSSTCRARSPPSSRASESRTPCSWSATIPVQAAVTEEMLTTVDVSRVLATYETTSRLQAWAARAQHPPRRRVPERYHDRAWRTLSFNQTVGPRTAERGFVEAPKSWATRWCRAWAAACVRWRARSTGAAVFGALDVDLAPEPQPSEWLRSARARRDGDLRRGRSQAQEPLRARRSSCTRCSPTPTTIRVELFGS